MKFKNTTGHKVKVRIDTEKPPYWRTVNPNEVIEIPESYGLRLGFTKLKVTEGKSGTKKIETKQFERVEPSPEFNKKLLKIKGIGTKTVKDIVNVYKSEAELRKAIKKKLKLPFRDDIEMILKKRFR